MSDIETSKYLKSNLIWIDASVYRSERFDWNGQALSELARLAERGLIRVVMSAITHAEITSLMREMWAEANKGVKAASIVLGQVGVPAAALAMADEAACLEAMRKAFDAWLTTCRVMHADVKPDLDGVMADYFAGRPPFGPGRRSMSSRMRSWCPSSGVSAWP